MKLSIFTLLMLALPLSGQAEKNDEVDKKYFVVFLATSQGRVGHAFVSFGYEDDASQRSVTDGTWGMYPKKDGNKKSVIGSVPGKIKDDYMLRSEIKMIKEVSESEYEAAIRVLKKWRSKNYELLESDCVTFVIEVAKAIGLKTPSRSGLDNFPSKYVAKLKGAN